VADDSLSGSFLALMQVFGMIGSAFGFLGKIQDMIEFIRGIFRYVDLGSW
jgi:hypothetical protein